MIEPVNYDLVAPAYDRRYHTHRFDRLLAVLQQFIGASQDADVAEAGCGTGHWLAQLEGRVRTAAGVDLSSGMLGRARAAAPFARLVRGRAEQLPWAAAAFDRLFCINALHHFAAPALFLREARRVLRPGGRLLIIGLDPHVGGDQWWVYDYFPSALDADRTRYLSTAVIRDQLAAAGFAAAATAVAEHIRSEIPFPLAAAQGRVDRRATSQLMVVSQAEYQRGLARLRAAQPTLHTDLRLYATVGTCAGQPAAAG